MNPTEIRLGSVDTGNWRACAALSVLPEQEQFVSAVSYYLCLCNYRSRRQPLAVQCGDAAGC